MLDIYNKMKKETQEFRINYKTDSEKDESSGNGKGNGNGNGNGSIEDIAENDGIKSELYHDEAIRNLRGYNPQFLSLKLNDEETQVLTKEQEIAYFKRLKKLRNSKNEEEELSCRNKIATHNLRLVIEIARKFNSVCYVGGGLEIRDIFDAGVIGLTTAIEKFDYRMGYKFSTYATWWIRQSIGRSLDDTLSMIRLPTYLRENIRTIRKAREE